MGLLATRRGQALRPSFVTLAVFAAAVATSSTSFADNPSGGNSSGHAATASQADKARANDLFKKSVEAYRRGELKQAIELLDEAYALAPSPVLVYNRARAEEALGNMDEAIKGYEAYLAQEPNAVDRGAIEQRLQTLKRQREDKENAEKERAAPKPDPVIILQPAPPPPHKRSILPYVVIGVGAAGLLTGTVFGLFALSGKDDAVAEPTQKKAMDLKDQADTSATISTVSFIAGAVLVAAGATWWVLDSPPSSKRGAGPKGGLAGVRVDRATVLPGYAALGGTF